MICEDEEVHGKQERGRLWDWVNEGDQCTQYRQYDIYINDDVILKLIT